MTWTVAISVVIGIIFKMIMSPPSAVVQWIVSKFALHPKLNSNGVTASYNGKQLDDNKKLQITHYFNNASVLKKYYIFPGNEKLFLHPETNVIPLVINVKRGRRDINLFVFCYDSHVDVVKQFKKKVVSYRLRSDNLQKFTTKTISKLYSSSV